jgi:Alr-MurF fusion protein
MKFSDLEKIGAGKTILEAADLMISDLVVDSRKPVINEGSLFFAIAGPRNDGHAYIIDLYLLGIRQFVIEKNIGIEKYPDANFLLASSSIRALQVIAEAHRKEFKFPVIGVTGSNGKTIIKEWLYQLLSPNYSIVKNPGSYNSQIGVPLSIWAMQPYHELGVFEAGISQPGEMTHLEKIIRPTIGIFTNIGPAHDEGFETLEQKISEKLKLFVHCDILIYHSNHRAVNKAILQLNIPKLSWGDDPQSDAVVKQTDSDCQIAFDRKLFAISIPFSDPASRENAMHCIVMMIYLGYDVEAIQKRINGLRQVSMRLELKEGINQCQLVDDSYNNDLAGLQISLDFLSSLQKRKVVILSDILQSGMTDDELAKSVSSLLVKKRIHEFIGIGPVLRSQQRYFSEIPLCSFYLSTEDFLNQVDFRSLYNRLILVKGARAFQFEKIVQRLQRKVHGTVMEIDMGKLVRNLNYFKSKLKPGVKVMAMVKAFAYGSGSEEVANLLQYHRIDYLGVAYADEGIELRKKNISSPIMVMNPTEESFATMLSQNLEPAIYSLKLLKGFIQFLGHRKAVIHLEVETGLHRLGLERNDLDEVSKLLKENPEIQIRTVFSHLSGSDEKKHDSFSWEQLDRYQKFYSRLSQELNIKPLRHILNSAGILRLPEFQMDMVRLGIGLYGVDPTEEKIAGLEMAATLKTVISQIKQIKAGETIGYARRGVAERDLSTATIAIGYADGFSRSFSNGIGCVLVNGKKAPVIGNVNMDMTMVDITGIDAQEGDEVIIFGVGLPITELAASCGTIPYEILTNMSERVKRVFVSEGI